MKSNKILMSQCLSKKKEHLFQTACIIPTNIGLSIFEILDTVNERLKTAKAKEIKELSSIITATSSLIEKLGVENISYPLEVAEVKAIEKLYFEEQKARRNAK